MSDDVKDEGMRVEPEKSRFPELDEMQREIERRLKDNQRFLERFLDDDFPDDDETLENDEDDFFEEL